MKLEVKTVAMFALLFAMVLSTGCADSKDFKSEKLGLSFSGYPDQRVVKNDGGEFVVSSDGLTVSFKKIDMMRRGAMRGPGFGPEGDGGLPPRPEGRNGDVRPPFDSLGGLGRDTLGGGMPPMGLGRMKRREADGLFLEVLKEAGVEADAETLEKKVFEGRNVKGAYVNDAEGNAYGVFRSGRRMISFSIKGNDPDGRVPASIFSSGEEEPMRGEMQRRPEAEE